MRLLVLSSTNFIIIIIISGHNISYSLSLFSFCSNHTLLSLFLQHSRTTPTSGLHLLFPLSGLLFFRESVMDIGKIELPQSSSFILRFNTSFFFSAINVLHIAASLGLTSQILKSCL